MIRVLLADDQADIRDALAIAAWAWENMPRP